MALFSFFITETSTIGYLEQMFRGAKGGAGDSWYTTSVCRFLMTQILFYIIGMFPQSTANTWLASTYIRCTARHKKAVNQTMCARFFFIFRFTAFLSCGTAHVGQSKRCINDTMRYILPERATAHGILVCYFMASIHFLENQTECPRNRAYVTRHRNFPHRHGMMSMVSNEMQIYGIGN